MIILTRSPNLINSQPVWYSLIKLAHIINIIRTSNEKSNGRDFTEDVLAGFHVWGITRLSQRHRFHWYIAARGLIWKLWVSKIWKLCRLLTEVEGGGPLCAALFTLELSFRRKQTNTWQWLAAVTGGRGWDQNCQTLSGIVQHKTQNRPKLSANLWEKWQHGRVFVKPNVSEDFPMKPNLLTINPKVFAIGQGSQSIGENAI